MSNNNKKIGPQEVHKLLTDWSSPITQRRRPAEQAIEQFLIVSNNEIDNFVMTLCQLLSHPQQTSSDIRQRIAILLRKRIAMKLDDRYKKPIFCQLHPNTRQQVLRVLIKQLSSDPDKDTRNQIADCITELSTRTFTELSNEYQNVQFIKSIFELYNLSDTKTTATNTKERIYDELNVTNRINALQIFGHLCLWCYTDPVIKQNQASIAQIYKVAFKQDTNRKVNIAALEAIQLTMKPLSSQDILGFIPLMFDVLKLLENTLNNEGQQVIKSQQANNRYIIDNDDYQQTQYILEIIIQIAGSQPLLFADHDSNNITSPLLPYCTAFTQLAITKDLPDKVRSLSLEFFLSLAENNPSLARKKQIIAKSVINICMDHFLLLQIDDNEWNEMLYGEDDDHNSLPSIGEYALDRLSNALTFNHVLPGIYNKLGLMMNNNELQNCGNHRYWNNNDWRNRHCALTVITQISDHMEHESKEVMMSTNKCLQLFKDKNYRIQFAAINCIGQLSNDHFDILPQQFGDRILNELLICLNVNNHIKIQTHSCAALINFVPTMQQKQIGQNKLDALINGVINVLRNGNNRWQNYNKSDQSVLKRNYQKAMEQALTAIAALAEAAGDLFNKHYDIFAPILMSIIKNAECIEMREVRCRAIECMGWMGEAVGGNKFSDYASELMNGTISYFRDLRHLNEISDDEFIKTNISVWPRILQSIGCDKFDQYLPTICEILGNVASISIISNRNSEIGDNDDFDYDEFTENNANNDDNMAIIETRDGFIALDAQKMDNKLSALYVIDSLSDKYGARMVQFMDKLFDILLECIKCKYSFEIRNDSAKLAPRYIQVMIDSISLNSANKQQLNIMSDKLLNVFINILDEGRQKTNNNAINGESACIGTVAKALLEFINIIDGTDNDDYNINKSVLRSCINCNKLQFIINCMFECVLRAQERIEIYSKQENNDQYDLIAKEEFEEEKQFEDGLIFDIAMILSQFIKIYRDDFLSILFKNENTMNQLLNFLNPPKNKNISNPQFIHKMGVYIVCDIYEQCSQQNISILLSKFIPLLFEIITNDQDAAVQQACFYCLGLMVNKCKNNTLNYIQQILKLSIQCITKHSQNYINSSICIDDDDDDNLIKKRQFLGVIDNAMATICKILKDINWNNMNNENNLNKLRNESLNIWFKHLPLKSDCVEAKICHEYLFKLLQNKNPIIIGQNLSNLPFLLKIFATIRNTKLSSNQLDKVIADFSNTIYKSQPQFVKNLTIKEKNNLGLK